MPYLFQDLFETFDITSMSETSLTTLQTFPNSTRTSDLTVTLSPMDIRTFIADVTNKLAVSTNRKNPYRKAWKNCDKLLILRFRKDCGSSYFNKSP